MSFLLRLSPSLLLIMMTGENSYLINDILSYLIQFYKSWYQHKLQSCCFSTLYHFPQMKPSHIIRRLVDSWYCRKLQSGNLKQFVIISYSLNLDIKTNLNKALYSPLLKYCYSRHHQYKKSVIFFYNDFSLKTNRFVQTQLSAVHFVDYNTRFVRNVRFG